MKRYLLLLLAAALSLQALPQSVVRLLDISVTLKDDGQAHVHEVWKIDIGDDVKTEWYVAHHNMGDRKIENLTMTDDGKALSTVPGEWDVDASIDEKAGKCGIKEADGGYEICWGVAEKRLHAYTADYDITGFVQGYPDNDGFGYWVADLNDNVAIEKFSIKVSAPQPLTKGNCSIWGFGFKGNAGVSNGIASAVASGTTNKAGLLMSFSKGVVHPSVEGKGTFSELKEKAFEGSDFGGGTEGEPMPVIVWVILCATPVLGVVFLIIYGIRISSRRRKAKAIPYCKDVPASCSLLEAARILDYYDWYKTDNLIGAIILRLLSQGKLEITSIDKRDKHGNRMKAFRVVPAKVEMPTSAKYSDDYICGSLLHIMSEVAGKDRVLETRNLEKWAKSHTAAMEKFNKDIHPGSNDIVVDERNRQSVLGLRNYLHDFGTVGERHVGNVNLWDDRMVYAQLFGIAKKLGDDIKAICPEYYSLSQFGTTVYNANHFYPRFFYLWYFCIRSSSATAATSTGSTSFGGGGGFSGGGGGGGR